MKGQIPVWSSEKPGTNLRTANRDCQIDRPYGPLMINEWEAQNILTKSIRYDILGVLIMDMVY